jgi:site-specific DNA-methyltransferase (adenine-specific)
VRKIQSFKEPTFDKIVSSRKPFGLATNVIIKQKKGENDVPIYAYPQNGYILKSKILKNADWTDKYKILMAKAYGERGSFPYLMLSKPFIAEKNSCCSETYMVIGPFDLKKEAVNTVSYIQTKFFRFLILLKKYSRCNKASLFIYSNARLQKMKLRLLSL